MKLYIYILICFLLTACTSDDASDGLIPEFQYQVTLSSISSPIDYLEIMTVNPQGDVIESSFHNNLNQGDKIYYLLNDGNSINIIVLARNTQFNIFYEVKNNDIVIKDGLFSGNETGVFTIKL